MVADLPGGTKQDILKLLVKQEHSAQSLAETLAVTPAAIRQHLETLTALGLVSRRKVVTQPSRPTYLYRLSPAGLRAFPKRYELLLGLVLDVIRDGEGPAAVTAVVQAAAERLARRVRPASGTESARPADLTDWADRLEQELAWQADIGPADGGGRRIVIYRCPFQDVARDHPDVCRVFFTTLLRALAGVAGVDALPAPPAPACCGLVVRPG